MFRFGVAPDHPDVKKCISTFNKTADLPNITFHGNTALGRDISLGRNLRNYKYEKTGAYTRGGSSSLAPLPLR